MTADDGNRLILASDRNYGLYILRYTGPGAVTAPAPGSPPPAGGLSTAPCGNAQSGTAGSERIMGTAQGDRIAAAAGQ